MKKYPSGSGQSAPGLLTVLKTFKKSRKFNTAKVTGDDYNQRPRSLPSPSFQCVEKEEKFGKRGSDLLRIYSRIWVFFAPYIRPIL